MSDFDPYSRQPHNGPDPYGHGPAPTPGHGPHPAAAPAPQPAYPAGPARRERPRDGSGQRHAALLIQSIGDVAAAFLGLWILLYLLDANRANPFVGFVQGTAEWFGWWAQDIFTMDVEGLRVLLNYGLPAVIYLALGHGIATWMRRL
ncbi:hypothetical protein [Streptomyces cavernicola]|uniref:YggT family protein n=1 Tax=Streptomyces cavernicola TaxID=3043613 RepID=A0ABT6SMD3_9ACTN|nr:hypothetical protein [Streptomyces sp. B-S-A6]MDI3409345.1 hypothetical protein [Streptomyces sp. B-S-A6]